MSSLEQNSIDLAEDDKIAGADPDDDDLETVPDCDLAVHENEPEPTPGRRSDSEIEQQACDDDLAESVMLHNDPMQDDLETLLDDPDSEGGQNHGHDKSARHTSPESPSAHAQYPDQLPLSPLPINPLDRMGKQEPSVVKRAKRSGLSGFRLFAKQYRLDHSEECKQSVAAVSKIIGAAWKALADHERVEWNRSASLSVAPELETAQQSVGSISRATILGSHLQLRRVKCIMQLDKDIHHISKEAAEFVRAGAELFIKFVCENASKYCGSRHSIQYADFSQMIKTEPKLKFLLGAFNKNNTGANKNGCRSESSSKRSRTNSSDPATLPPSKSSKITSFFQKAHAAG